VVPTDDLNETERKETDELTRLRPRVVYEVVRHEGEDELKRPVRALGWSGLAAGLSMGFSLLTEGFLRARLPDAPWAPLVSRFGYTVGFVLVILGRQQLFTENTITVIIPLLARPRRQQLWRVARLWSVVLAANLLGAFAFALLLVKSGFFDAAARDSFARLAMDATHGSFGATFVKAILAGWLIALMVWMLPSADQSRLLLVFGVTYVIGVAGLSHVVAGSVEAFYGLLSGTVGARQALVDFVCAALLGNIVGGVGLVAALNHAQVVAGSDSAVESRS
jgi:formate/nitrite transporter FocA (FNT family)